MFQHKHPELTRLVQLSACIGRQPLLAQASSGNISVKVDGILWIKASGKWLADAAEAEILVPVDLREAQEAIRRGVDICASHASSSGDRLRASIETSMHAVLPHSVVLHVHSANTIAWAVRKDGPLELGRLLAGLAWEWIPYVSSGLPLARSIERAMMHSPDANVFILANHGLVVCGSDCQSAEDLLNEVERRLAREPRGASDGDYANLRHFAQETGYRLPADSSLHALATDEISRRILAGGVLFPCQAIFLAPKAPIIPAAAVPQLNEYEDCPFLIVEDAGVLVSKHITRAEHATLEGLREVVQRIDALAPISYLTELEISGVLDADAHRYRDLAEHHDSDVRLAF